MTSQRVYLTEEKRNWNGKPAIYYVLRWKNSRNRTTQQSLGRSKKTGGTVTRAEAEEARRRKEHELAKGTISRDKPTRIALAPFIELYKERRRQGDTGRGFRRGSPRLSEATITDHVMTLRYLAHYFGDGCALESISATDAECWADAVAGGRLSGARNQKIKRDYGKLSEQTVRGHIRNAKAIFTWAHRFGFVATNPFADFDGKPIPSGENHYVTAGDFERLVKAAPSCGWKALYALCRLAGLRKTEALEMRWSGRAVDKEGGPHRVGVDWERRRLQLVAVKTRRYREVPICPRLYELLLDAFDAADAGEESVTGLTPNNLTRNAKKHINSAGLAPWAKTFQALRSSCENEWKEKGIQEATYCAWLGHSPAVSRASYVAPLESEYAAVTQPEE